MTSRFPYRMAASAAIAALGLMTIGGVSALAAQTPAYAAAIPASAVRSRLPFAPGEEMQYEAHYGPAKVGRGSIKLEGVELVRGVPTFHLVFQVRGGVPFFRVNDVFQSWVDTTSLTSLRFEKWQQEGGRTRAAQFEIFPEQGLYVEAGKDPAPSVSAPLDDASFLYFVRTVSLEVGEYHTFDRYFKPDRNPVGIRVLRRERITVPAGTFDAVVVQPEINTSGLLSKSRKTEVWLSDDARRVVLQVRSHLPFGTLKLALTSYQPGSAVTLPAVARAEP